MHSSNCRLIQTAIAHRKDKTVERTNGHGSIRFRHCLSQGGQAVAQAVDFDDQTMPTRQVRIPTVVLGVTLLVITCAICIEIAAVLGIPVAAKCLGVRAESIIASTCAAPVLNQVGRRPTLRRAYLRWCRRWDMDVEVEVAMWKIRAREVVRDDESAECYYFDPK